MFFVNISTMQIIPQFTQIVKNNGEPWNINNYRSNTMIGLDGVPVPNPDYVSAEPVSEANFPYLKQNAYDNFSKIMFAELEGLVTTSVAQDDSNGCFDTLN